MKSSRHLREPPEVVAESIQSLDLCIFRPRYIYIYYFFCCIFSPPALTVFIIFFPGINMDLNAFAALKKQKAKAPGQKEPTKQKPLGEFLKKGSEPSEEAAKRKAAGKAPIPEGKRQKKGDAGKKAPPVLVVDEHFASEFSAQMATTAPRLPSGQGGEASLPREDIRFSLPKGAAITHGTVDPREFFGGATPALDRRALGKLDDEALESKILRSSLTPSTNTLGGLMSCASRRRNRRSPSKSLFMIMPRP
ncbi:unnamed protein product [Cuscuta europaea]|uniref:Uncharacterized protein n=1 Tax=Cuscuta europaea TaxID=41803 RepID=A0A9P0ZDH6_CUSEU|nr:unnamed protein product [Cuscuta europaea]